MVDEVYHLQCTQTLDSIHLNPVKEGYVEDAVHWRCFSARKYQGQIGLIQIYNEC